MHLFVLSLALLLCACGARSPVSPPPAPAPPSASAGLSVRLLWNERVDLDLYLTDPTWETLYFANNPTRSGAKIERDARCDTLAQDPPFVESARLDEPAPGPYRIGVHFIDPCAADVEEAAFRLVVDLDGGRVEKVATLRRDEFRVIALQFEIAAGDGENGGARRIVVLSDR